MFLLPVRSLPFFRKSFRKTGFSVRKPFPTGDSKISKSLKCAPVQAGTLPRGAKVSETQAFSYHPTSGIAPPGDPQNRLFSIQLSPKAQAPPWAPSLDPWRATWSPMAPPGSQMVPKMTQNGYQNVSQKASRTQNTECEQNLLFTMFQPHFGLHKRLENMTFSFQNLALAALPIFWPPGGPQ